MASHALLDIDEQWAATVPFNFYGPCSAESEEQMLQTAAGIAAGFNSPIYRAGIWKPRTRPNSFEGVGTIGLAWLKKVKEEYGFQTSTEVANANHVEHCLKQGVDILWIGARTTVSPFAVQEIAEALKGVDIPVFVKNPIHADLSLWIGALERFNKVGVRKLGAIHRGFHQLDSAPYRNLPKWELVIELMGKYPNLPMVCDVSHICGTPELIPHVAQKAMDLNMNGLMVETHVTPKIALSDAKQQITPEVLIDLVSQLERRARTTDNEEYRSNLEILRGEIDKIDAEAIELMARRMELAKKIGLYKRDNKVTILQVDRWQNILDRSIENGKALGLSAKFVKGLLNNVHDESIRQQNSIMNPDHKRPERT